MRNAFLNVHNAQMQGAGPVADASANKEVFIKDLKPGQCYIRQSDISHLIIEYTEAGVKCRLIDVRTHCPVQ